MLRLTGVEGQNDPKKHREEIEDPKTRWLEKNLRSRKIDTHDIFHLLFNMISTRQRFKYTVKQWFLARFMQIHIVCSRLCRRKVKNTQKDMIILERAKKLTMSNLDVC